MKKATFTVLSFFVFVSLTHAQQVVEITSFEDVFEGWSFGGAVSSSLVDFEPIFNEIDLPDGENALVLEWSNNGNGWEYWSGTFPIDATDLSGMTQLHMSIYITEDSVGYTNDDGEEEFSFRLEANSGVGLGTNNTTTKGDWVEMVWQIPQPYINEGAPLTSWNYMAGFFNSCGECGDNAGTFIIDRIWATGPEEPYQYEEALIYGFNNPDPFAFVEGWEDSGTTAFYGDGEAEPAEGENYLSIVLGSGWTELVGTADNDLYQRIIDSGYEWNQAAYVTFDVLLPDYPESWANSTIALNSWVTDVESGAFGWDQKPEQGIGDATDEWKTIAFVVNPEDHSDAFTMEGGGMEVGIITNNPGGAEGSLYLVDNFRFGFRVNGTPVPHWNLY